MRRLISLRRISAGLLAGMALVALGGCYPYYYDFHYSHGDGYYKHGHHGKRYHFDSGHYYQRDRRKRYKHYRGY